MRLSISATAATFATLLMVCSLAEAAPAPGCKRTLRELTELEASLKRELKIPFHPQANPLKNCDITQPRLDMTCH